MVKRKALSKKTRFDVFKRDEFECQYCGATPPKAVLHVDHITPVKEGGENDIDNLVTACIDCNLGKGARPLESVPESLKDKAARIKDQEAQLAGYVQIMRDKKDRKEADSWEVADVFIEAFRDDGIRKDWLLSIGRFNDSLGVIDVVESMELATSKKRSKNTCFKYFCGICWRKIREQDNG